MLDALLCLLGCLALGDLNALADGAQVQVASADLSTIYVTGSVHHGELELEADFPPLADVVLLISHPLKPPLAVRNVSSVTAGEVVSLSGFISPSGQDIMVQEPSGTLSLKDWLGDHHIALDLSK